MLTNNLSEKFSDPLLAWFEQHGRKDLPWQHPRSPYRVWVSEIMLQQTQVQTVIPYFERFMQNFTNVQDLANASEEQVMAHWSGLGYYSRARNLHRSAKIICEEYGGEFPRKLEQLMSLPGIGQSTAAAIISQAFNTKAAILDGNVKRVLSRYFAVEGWPEQAAVKKALWQLAEACMPEQHCADYTQAIMDLGASCCSSKNPQCHRCPVQASCTAFLQNKVQHYPFKAVKKTLPVKHQQFLILHKANNSIYLEKNPPTGLWGSLWCMPSIDQEGNIVDFVLERFGYQVKDIKKLLNLKHSFSHFHLHITAQLVSVENNNLLKELPGKWFDIEQTTTLGLAKPIKVILDQLTTSLSQEE